MIIKSLLYSLKIWLTSVFAAPFLLLLVNAIRNVPGLNLSLGSPENYICDVFLVGVFQLIFSFCTWIVFLLVIFLALKFITNAKIRTWTIFLTGILLTSATFYLLLFRGFTACIHSEYFPLMLCNCFCIGSGTWIYKLNRGESIIVQ